MLPLVCQLSPGISCISFFYPYSTTSYLLKHIFLVILMSTASSLSN